MSQKGNHVAGILIVCGALVAIAVTICITVYNIEVIKANYGCGSGTITRGVD